MRLTLDGDGWSVKVWPESAREPADLDEKEWFAAQVPGVIHLDLLRAGRLADPFFGTRELDARWIDTTDWVYRRELELTEPLLAQQSLELVCEGLDTLATLWLNGQLLGSSQNMFIPHHFDLRPAARLGTNTLVIRFQSAERLSQELQERFGRLAATDDDRRVYLRKAQVQFGWDFAPRFLTAGIWRPIRIEAHSQAQLGDILAQVPYVDTDQAVLEVQIPIRRLGQSGHRSLTQGALEVQVALAHEASGFEFSQRLAVAAHDRQTQIRIEIPRPQLWWPAGYGQPNLYSLSLILLQEGQVLDVWNHAVGLRTIRLLEEPDAEGQRPVPDPQGRLGIPRSFTFQVNGKKIFCRGANWVPADSFLPRVSRQHYQDLLEQAHQTGLNMLRVWGGGIYEDPAFYQACDQKGILVWQDFLFACGYYPEASWFLDLIRQEATAAITRLRNHACLALWCGNNENEQALQDHWFRDRQPPAGPDGQIHWGKPIFYELLPQLCATLDPSRPYWPGSPNSHSGYAQYALDGDFHRWDVWSGGEPASRYQTDVSRFMSEFGFQSLPTFETLQECLPPTERYFFSPTLAHHNKQVGNPNRQLPEGIYKLQRYVSDSFVPPPGGDLEAWSYLTQVIQARAIQMGVDHWRSQKFHCAGTLFWQLNDCWPGATWSAIDYAKRPKALWYYARRFFSPVRVVLNPRTRKKRSGLIATLINDTSDRLHGQLHWRLQHLHGRIHWEKELTVELPANSLQEIDFPPESLSWNPREDFWFARLEYGGQRSESFYFEGPDKSFQTGRPELLWKVHAGAGHAKETADGFIRLHARQLVRDVYLNFPQHLPVPEGSPVILLRDEVELEDNFVTLLPGQSREIPFRLFGDTTLEQVSEHLRILETSRFSGGY